MWYHHVIWAIVTLFFTVLILLFIGISIFKLSRKFSDVLFSDIDLKYLDIVFVGAILIALSQLFGPLVASTYPIIFGQDASDYRLKFDNEYINTSCNYASNNLSMAKTTAGFDQYYNGAKAQFSDNNTFYNRITAINMNPFVKYNEKIILDNYIADGIIVGFTQPIIEVGQSSDLIIKFQENPLPGLYRIKVMGMGGDGKIHDAMMVIEIPETPNEEVVGEGYYFVNFNFSEAAEGSGYFMNYRIINLGDSGTGNGSGTIDNQKCVINIA